MKFRKLNLLSFFLYASSEIAQIYSQTISDEQLNEFSYGAEEFKLAVIGDSGTEREAREVMKLTTYDALLHLGDFDYSCDADKYFNSILDSDRSYQFMGVLGNHEGVSECGTDKNQRFLHNVYDEMISSKNSKVKCEFSSSKFMWACVYKNMRIIGLTSGVNGADKRNEQLSFLKKHLTDAKEDWKVCAWHFYDKYFHTGKYPGDGNIISGSGESFYDFCRENGAIIFSAHDHVYARTHVMSKFKEPTIDKFDSKTSEEIVQIREGATIDILNGAGGYEMYIEQGEQKDYPHWQKKYAKGSDGENAKKYGGLFCNFNHGGNNRKAYCEFLRINSSNKLFDSFYIYRNDDPSTITYEQIDANFKDEKLKAYKEANNIPLNDDDDPSDTKTNGAQGGKSSGKKDDSSKEEEEETTLFSTRNIAIGGSICAALVIIGGGLLTYNNKNKKRKEIKDDEILGGDKTNYNSNEGRSYTFNVVSNNYKNNSNNNNTSFYDDNKKINDGFAPLSIPDVTYSKNGSNNDYDNNYDHQGFTKSQTSYNSDALPLVISQPTKSYESDYQNSKYNKYQ